MTEQRGKTRSLKRNIPMAEQVDPDHLSLGAALSCSYALTLTGASVCVCQRQREGETVCKREHVCVYVRA